MSEEKKDYSDENRRRMLLALAIYLGAKVENGLEHYGEVPKQIMREAKAVYFLRGLEKAVETPERLGERDIQIRVAETGMAEDVRLYRIAGVSDDKTCPDCAAWRGKTVTMRPDGVHDTVQDFINQHGFHVNCRCSLQAAESKEIPLNKLNPRYEERKAVNPAAYNQGFRLSELVFN